MIFLGIWGIHSFLKYYSSENLKVKTSTKKKNKVLSFLHLLLSHKIIIISSSI